MAVTTVDIDNWCKPELLDIASVEIPEYFFKEKVQVN